MVELEIDGKQISAPDGATIIEAADLVGIYIPRYCYHKKLSIAANCRMCLVEVERSGKPLPACATPVTPNMKVMTQSPKALEAQRSVMEFLLINHPLDCPICDQGGECDLQDLAMGYGTPYSYYNEGKRAVYSEDIGTLIETWMTRCIQCTRCVRFGEEVAGLRELGVIWRGEKEEISTYIQHFLKSELSGNIIDLCPVGALTSKPYRYSARGWEMIEHRSIGAHDCVGSNLYHHSRGQEYAPQRFVMRTVPRENEMINETWISDRDRFSYEGLHHEERVAKPRMKKNGRWIEVDWERALLEIADRLNGLVQNQGADQIAAIASPNATVEGQYLLQKLMRAIGCHNVDHRIHQHDFSDQDLAPGFPDLGMKIADIDELHSILLVGSNARFEQPMIAHRINMAAQDGASVMAVNPADYAFNFDLAHKMIAVDIIQSLAEIAKVLADEANQEVAAIASITPGETARHIAKSLKQDEWSAIFLGEFAMDHPQAAQIRSLTRLIANLSGAKVGVLTHGANSSGAWLAGMVPHRGAAGEKLNAPGLDAKSVFTDHPRRAYLLLNVEPELDTAYPAAALQALQQAGLVVCLTTFATDIMQDYADFILPVSPYTETAGTFVNIEGTWQSFSAVSQPHEDSKPTWKILRVLANLMKLEDFQYQTAHEVRDELQGLLNDMPTYTRPEAQVGNITKTDGLLRLAPWPIYRTDNLVRRAKSLQEVAHQDMEGIRVNQATADTLNLQAGEKVTAIQGDSRVSLPLFIDSQLADHVVLLPAGVEQTAGFGETLSTIQLERGA